MPEPTAAEAHGWRAHWPILVVAALAAVVALWARLRLFPAYSWNRDEPVYLWHVDVLRSGRLTATDGGYPELFHPWLSARGDGVLFTQYTLGWPLVLLGALAITGTPASALPVGAALAVVGTYVFGLEVLRDRRVATLGAGLMVASPILAIQGGVYLSYLFTLGLGLVAGALLLSGVRLGRGGRLVAAGLLLGWVFLTRPYDALLWGGAFALYALIRDPSRWRRSVRDVAVCVVGALPLVVATLAYNRAVTGRWLQFPITAADPLDTFGFGRKRLMPTFEVVDYDLTRALRATAKNAFVLPWFLVGSYVGLALAAVGLWQRRAERATAALVLVGAVFPVGYFVFWGNHLSSLASRISGPIYFVPLYAPICLLIAGTLVRWWPDRRRRVVVAAALLVLGTIPAALSRFDLNRSISAAQQPWRDSVTALSTPAIVFVADTAPYLLYLNPFSANTPDLDGPIIYAVDGDPAMLDLIAAMPGRTPYLQQASLPAQEVGPREDPRDLTVSVTPVVVRRGSTVALAVTLRRPDADTTVHLSISTGAATQEITLPADGSAAMPRQDVVLVPSGEADGLAVADRGTVSLTVGYGASAQDAAQSPRWRASLVYRLVAGRIEVALPVAHHELVHVDGVAHWRRSPGPGGLIVEVSAKP